MDRSDKRARDRRHDAKREAEKPWRAWYRSPAWQAKRRAQLSAEPWCRLHAKRGERVAAAIVDHVQRHRGDHVLFWGGALQSLCKGCHDGLKQAWERGRVIEAGVDGMPKGAGHPWV